MTQEPVRVERLPGGESSAPVPGGTPSGKENRPTSCGGPKGRGRHPYSPEEVREFMTKKVAERSRRVREEKQTSQQAREARKRRLQEVYRKQRAALGSKRSHAEAPRLAEGTSPLALDRQDSIQGHLSDAPSGRAFSALLRKEPKGSRLVLGCAGIGPLWPVVSKRPDPQGRIRRVYHGVCSQGGAAAAESIACREVNMAGLVGPWSGAQASFAGARSRALQELLAADVREGGRKPHTQCKVGAVGGKKPGPVTVRKGGRYLALLFSSSSGSSFSLQPEGRVKRSRTWGSPSSWAPAGGASSPLRLRDLATSSAPPQSPLLPGRAPLAGCGAVAPGSPWGHSLPRSTGERLRVVQGVARELSARVESAMARLRAAEGPLAWSSRGGLPGLFAVSSADPLAALRQNSGAENSREKQLEKVDVEEAQETGLRPGTWLDFSRQQEASVCSPPSANLTHSKDESEDRSEATSRWSEASPFYGGSSTFCRCGLTMAAQCLREEELRARHQSALLRLREEALREQLRAELAWLEQRTRLQGPEGASSAEEQQDRIRTRLKQEQAEIQHLQNVCRAARQRRRLLLRQHQELLRVRQSTVWLWRETHRLAGASQRPAVVALRVGATPTSPGSTRDLLGEGRKEEEAPRPDNTPPTERMIVVFLCWAFAWAWESLCAERGATPSPRTEVAEGAPEWESQELLGVAAGDLHARRGRAECPLPQTGSTMGTAGTESLPLDSEFHKARAVLVNISGSSSSASDWEAEASQATDVSLPEEFVLPEPLHEAGDAAGTAFPDAPAVPQITREPRGHVSCGESQGGSSVLHSLEEPPEDTAGSSGTPQSGAADDGVLKSDSAQAGGTLSSQADAHPDKHNAALPKASALLPKSAEKSGLDKMLFQGRPQSVAAVPSSVRCPENWRKQSPTLATGTAERDAGRRQGRPDLDAQPIPYAREASSNNGDATSDPARGVVLLPNDQMPPLTRPPSSQGLSSPGSRASPTERPGGGTRVSSGPDVGRESKGHAQADAQTSFAKTVESAKEPQHLPAAESPSAEVSEPGGLRSRSPNAGKVSQGKSFLSGSKDSPGCVSDELVPGVEDAVRSRVDEALPCRSPDPPSQDAAFPSEDLPAPPEDPRGTQDDSSHSTLSDFPPPPEQLLFPEAGEFESSTVESASAKSNPAPASLLENPLPEAPGPLPLQMKRLSAELEKDLAGDESLDVAGHGKHTKHP
ncbi:hypothetical protein lerEdw1_009345 [Lerista edwardsae]|nr:hypothetical protein lerEdw1_009345 [Lerista edwardsae]